MGKFKRNKNEITSRKKNTIKKKNNSKKVAFSGDFIKFENKNDNDDGSKKNIEDSETVVIKLNSKRPLLSNIKAINKKNLNEKSKYPGRAPINSEKLKYHSRGVGMNVNNIKFGIIRKKFLQKEKLINYSTQQAARSELLLPEDAGYLIADENEHTLQYTQREITENVDITSATKHFELNLDLGPYRMNYTRNGRHLLLGGQRGHVAAFDWIGKRLSCEFNVMEEVFDVSWLHNELMFAVAQKKWLYLYDNQGVEMHCIKHLAHVLRMEFLPYHFLLATSNEFGYVGWLDVSIGKLVALHQTHLGRLSVMTQNPYNAILCLGHSKGVVSMWSPNLAEPAAKLLCHNHPINSIAVDPYGNYMATSASDRNLKIWDVRKLKGPLQNMKFKSVATHIQFSQRGLLGVGMGNVVEVYKDVINNPSDKAYLRHKMHMGVRVQDIQFCPYEDILGTGHSYGFTSLLVPGSGEPNFDTFEVNPYQTKTQRKEAEVKSLLEKIQPELITLDPTKLAEVNIQSLKEKIEEKKKLLFIKTPKIDFTPRQKSGKNKGSVKAAKSKKIVKEQFKKQFREQVNKKEIEQELRELADNSVTKKKESIPKKDNQEFFIKSLERFKTKS